MTALRIGGLIADHPGVRQGEAEVVARPEQEARRRLAAFACAGVSRGESVGMMEAITEARETDAGRIQLRY